MRTIFAAILVLILGSAVGISADDAKPVITIPVHALRVADDDGGRPAVVTADQVKQWVDFANKVYSPAGIRFDFNPDSDWSPLNNTAVNNMLVDQRESRTSSLLGNEIAAEHPGKLAILIRHGPGKRPTYSGFARHNANYVAMPGYGMFKESGHPTISAFAHETGHYLGLWHTHPGGPFKTLKDAEAYFVSHGKKPSAFDGDGLSDTPPDPAVSMLDTQRGVFSMELGGVEFKLPRRNLMSYYEERDSLTPQQLARARWFVEQRARNNMISPTNLDAKSGIQEDAIKWTGMNDCRVAVEKIPGYDVLDWSNDSWLWLRFEKKGYIKLTLPETKPGRTRIDLYTGLGPTFGKMQFSLDSKPIGESFDAYAPMTRPSGRISLGTVDLKAGKHTLQIEAVGKSEASTGYNFAIDCIALVNSQ